MGWTVEERWEAVEDCETVEQGWETLGKGGRPGGDVGPRGAIFKEVEHQWRCG